MTPFFKTVDAPPEINVTRLTDALVMTPGSGQPTSLMAQLSAVFGEDERVRGFLPVVSSLSVELSRRADAEERRVPECEYVISSDAFAMLRQQYGTDGANGIGIDPPTHIDSRVYEGDLPYGLFVSDERFALAAYNEIGRVQAVVESTNETAIEWGEKMYETYRRRSVRPHEADTTPVERDAELVD